jgi:hypothetical protein
MGPINQKSLINNNCSPSEQFSGSRRGDQTAEREEDEDDSRSQPGDNEQLLEALYG